MTDVNQFHDQVFDDFKPKKKMPDMVNVLSILTFIASGIYIIMAFVSYSTVCQKAVELDEKMGDIQESKGFLGSMLKGSMETMHRSCEMRLPILIIALICLIACIIGAILMRQLKKSGYYIYLIGEIGQPIAMVALVGAGIISTIFAFLIPAVFLILYGTQLKEMK